MGSQPISVSPIDELRRAWALRRTVWAAQSRDSLRRTAGALVVAAMAATAAARKLDQWSRKP